MHKNHTIYERAMNMLEGYFQEEQSNVDDIMDMISKQSP